MIHSDRRATNHRNQPFSAIHHWHFDISKEVCSHEFSDGWLEVTPMAIQFWESSCDLTNPTNLRGLPDAKLYDAVCYGEGEEWTYRVMLATDYRGDLIRYTQEGAWTSVRCQ